jgi:hypothetical protein
MACRFCPQDRLAKSYPKGEPRDLSLSDFLTVLEKLPPYVRVDFSGMAEPWLNRDATAMAILAFERRRTVAIYTTLQGMAPDDATLLIERFGSRITPEAPWVIHLPDGDGNMTGWKSTETYRETLRRFLAFERLRMPEGLNFMTMSADGTVAPVLRDLVIETLPPFRGISRAENLDRDAFRPGALLAAVRQEHALLCASTPFFDHNVLLPNGDVLLCCMDYGRQHVVGNLLRQSYEAIHSGVALGGIRLQAMTPSDGAAVPAMPQRRLPQAAGRHTLAPDRTGDVVARGVRGAGALSVASARPVCNFTPTRTPTVAAVSATPAANAS